MRCKFSFHSGNNDKSTREREKERVQEHTIKACQSTSNPKYIAMADIRIQCIQINLGVRFIFSSFFCVCAYIYRLNYHRHHHHERATNLQCWWAINCTEDVSSVRYQNVNCKNWWRRRRRGEKKQSSRRCKRKLMLSLSRMSKIVSNIMHQRNFSKLFYRVEKLDALFDLHFSEHFSWEAAAIIFHPAYISFE